MIAYTGDTTDLYNELCEKFEGQNIVKQDDIIKEIGYDNFVRLVRAFWIVIEKKDDDGTVWYSLS